MRQVVHRDPLGDGSAPDTDLRRDVDESLACACIFLAPTNKARRERRRSPTTRWRAPR